MSDAQLSQALATAGPRVFAYLTLAAYGGLRAMEVAAVRGEDVGEKYIVINGKGNTLAMVPTHAKVLALCASHPRQGWWFPGVDHGHVNSQTVSQVTAAHLRKVGVEASVHRARSCRGSPTRR
jgi:integrase